MICWGHEIFVLSFRIRWSHLFLNGTRNRRLNRRFLKHVFHWISLLSLGLEISGLISCFKVYVKMNKTIIFRHTRRKFHVLGIFFHRSNISIRFCDFLSNIENFADFSAVLLHIIDNQIFSQNKILNWWINTSNIYKPS